MYSPKIISDRLLAAERKLGFKLQRHSPAETQAARAQLDSLLDAKGNLTRQLTAKEQRFIRNERALCASDFLYTATRYYHINDNTNRLRLFTPTLAQRIMVDIWGDLEAKQAEIVVQCLKARQLGLSTISELAIAHRVQFMPQVRAIVGSSDPDKSALMSRMMELAWSEAPWWLMPSRTKYKSGVLIEFGNQNSVVSIQHGTQFSGLGRGTTVTSAHLSEVCDYDDPSELIDASLMPAIHPSPRVFCILESTAKSSAGWWYDTWQLAKRGYDQGISRFMPVFLPWYVGEDMYPHPTWLASRQAVFAAWQPSEHALQHKARAEEYVHNYPLLRKHLGAEWQMSREQMFWWDMHRIEHKEKGILYIAARETPANDVEAFQSGNASIFDAETLERLRAHARQPLACFGVLGNPAELPARLQPPAREIDPTRKPIEVNANWGVNSPASRYLLMPLKYDASRFDPLGKLVVWALPEKDAEYAIGVDTAEGVGADRTVIEVVRKGDIARNDEAVAEYASDAVSAFDLWPILLAIATLYSTPRNNRIRQCLVAIECNGNGEACQLELKKRGWWNFHQWIRYDSKRINKAKAVKLGWYTNAWSRPLMLDNLIKYVRDGWLDLHSQWLINEEMASFELDADKNKLLAAAGAHDDRIMALGIALFCAHDTETRGARPSVAEARIAESAGSLVHPTYPGHPAANPDLPWDSPVRSYIEYY